MKFPLRLLISLTLFAVLAFAQRDPITIGSKIDTEGSVLAQMIRIVLEDAGIETVDRSGFGTTSVVREALLAGEIDLYPEYTGTALTFFPNMTIPEDISTDAAQAYGVVRVLDLNENSIVWLGRSPANNTWAVAVPQALAEENNLVTIADLARYINEGGNIRLVGSQEFVDRPDALPAFERVYGFSLTGDNLIVLAGGNTTQTMSAAAQGTDGANAAMSYGTDGALPALGLVALTDPAGAVAVYQPAPIVRLSVYEAYPELRDLLDPVFAVLTEGVLAELNGRVQVEGENAEDVARDFLSQNGFID